MGTSDSLGSARRRRIFCFRFSEDEVVLLDEAVDHILFRTAARVLAPSMPAAHCPTCFSDRTTMPLSLEFLRRRPMITALVFVLVSGLALAAWLHYRTQTVLVTNDVRVEGSLVTISSRLDETVRKVYVAEGDAVKAGDILMELDRRAFEARRDEACAEVALARARLAEVRAGFRPEEKAIARAKFEEAAAAATRAERDYGRIKLLREREGGVTLADLDAALAAYRTAQALRNAAEAELKLKENGSRPEVVEAAKAALARAEAALALIEVTERDLIVRSPVNGRVAQRLAHPGELLRAGSKVLTIVNDDDLWLRARIEETRIGDIRTGQPVDFTIDAYPGKVFHGFVTEISPAVASAFALVSTDNAAGYFTKVVQRVPVRISLPKDADVAFRLGMQGSATFEAAPVLPERRTEAAQADQAAQNNVSGTHP